MLPALIPLIGPALNKLLDLIPDKGKREEARLKYEAEIRASEADILKTLLAADTSQAEINKAEAANPKLFVSGWRPFVGWTCGVGCAWAFVLKPFADWAVALASRFNPALVGFQTPVLNTGELMSLLLGLLGMAGMRSFEKYKGVK